MVILKTNLKFNILVKNVNFYNQSMEDTMVKKTYVKLTDEQKKAHVRANTSYMNLTAYRRLVNAERFAKAICKHLKIEIEDDFTKSKGQEINY